MANFIDQAAKFFDVILDALNEFWNGIVTLINALAFISEGIGSVFGIFPTFIATIMGSCLTLLIVLRVIGR